jgi:hypothetical protein
MNIVGTCVPVRRTDIRECWCHREYSLDVRTLARDRDKEETKGSVILYFFNPLVR